MSIEPAAWALIPGNKHYMLGRRAGYTKSLLGSNPEESGLLEDLFPLNPTIGSSNL